jgi:phospholipid transport system substrate-binding protein
MQLDAAAPRWIAASALTLALVCPARADAPASPQEVIEAMDRVVLDQLQVRRTDLDRDPEALFALARSKVRPHFDLEHTARMVVGPAWQGATEGARAAFVAAFERYLVSSYARALLFVRDETLTVLGPPSVVDATHATLPMRVVMVDGTAVETEVHFRLERGAWRIWDIRASGISFVRQYRGDFGTEARVRGLAACTESLLQIAERNESELRKRLQKDGSIRRAR